MRKTYLNVAPNYYNERLGVPSILLRPGLMSKSKNALGLGVLRLILSGKKSIFVGHSLHPADFQEHGMADSYIDALLRNLYIIANMWSSGTEGESAKLDIKVELPFEWVSLYQTKRKLSGVYPNCTESLYLNYDFGTSAERIDNTKLIADLAKLSDFNNISGLFSNISFIGHEDKLDIFEDYPYDVYYYDEKLI